MNQFPLPYDQRWKLSEQTDSEGRRYIRVPIAVVGEWDHPEYGKVTFSQKDFDDIQTNWVSRVTGYEPPLYLGHPIDRDSHGGAPAVAFLEKLYQEDETLYGEYEPVDDQAFEDTRSGKFRYSSAEIVREAVSKETGESIGTLLVGAALTNTPFLTRMPRVEAGVQQYSESKGTATLFAVSLDNPEPSTMDTSTKPTIDLVKFTELASLVESLQTKLEDTTAKLETTTNELSETRGKLKKQELEQRLSEVSSLNLTAAVKEQYSDMLRKEVLSEAQSEEVMSLLRTLSAEHKQTFTESKGSPAAATETGKPEGDTEPVNPYAAQIARNQKLAEKLRSERLAA